MKYRFMAVIMTAFLMLPAFGVTAFAYDDSGEEDASAEVTASAVEELETEPEQSSNAFTPSGTGTVVDTATDADSKQFYTITTPAGNVFYLIIDLERDSDNVYFLDAVTEKDLLALAETSDDTGTGESVSAIPDTTGTASDTTAAPETEDTTEPETEPEAETESGGSPATLIIAVAVVLIAGGAGYYFKVYRPKQLAGGEDEYEPEEAGEDNSGGWDDTPDDWNDNASTEDEDDGPPWYEDDADGEEDDNNPPWDEDDTGEDNDE